MISQPPLSDGGFHDSSTESADSGTLLKLRGALGLSAVIRTMISLDELYFALPCYLFKGNTVFRLKIERFEMLHTKNDDSDIEMCRAKRIVQA